MTLQLSHIGEPLVAAMLSMLCRRGKAQSIRCAVTGRHLLDDLDARELEFHADRAKLQVVHDGQRFDCDGAQKVDVLAAGADKAIAIELKLGVTRLSTSEFSARFSQPCTMSKHSRPKINGSMIAVLERSTPFEMSKIFARIEDRQWTVAEAWWLVVRKRVFDRWEGDWPVRTARIALFESLAEAYGDQSDFDDLVHSIVGTGFFSRWEIAPAHS